MDSQRDEMKIEYEDASIGKYQLIISTVSMRHD